MKKNVRYLMAAFLVMVMLYGLNGCSSINENGDAGQILTEFGNGQTAAGVGDDQSVGELEDKQITEQDNSDRMDETKRSEEHGDIEKATSGEDLDVVVPNAADNDWYMKGNIYTDDKGNRLEVFFNDHDMLEFAVNGLSLYFTTVDNFQQENNWKVYTCDDGTMIIYYPGEPAHLEISDGDYAGLYEAGGDKMR